MKFVILTSDRALWINRESDRAMHISRTLYKGEMLMIHGSFSGYLIEEATLLAWIVMTQAGEMGFITRLVPLEKPFTLMDHDPFAEWGASW